MFNYLNLNDVEFEELCKDVMERKLKMRLRTYAKGRDGGINLGDTHIPMRVFVQVKHYGRSTFSSLKTSLQKEIPKVENHNPKQYYLCISKELTASNIEEIYMMFHNYMDSSANIVTLKEIDDFLQKETNTDIVQKHFKLWLHASGILSQMYNRNMFIDCEMLFANIDEEKKIYVQTNAFERSLQLLEKNRILMIIGAPGVGKTVTSKMLLLKMAGLDYRVRYSTNGDISEIKRSLSIDPDQKEIILLDDCLGQHYFTMSDRVESELISIINYIKMHPNKLLIMNSRVTILNEAKARSIDFEKISDENTFQKYIINMDDLSYKDKSRILYNHLIAQNLPQEYLIELEKNDCYRDIVEHPNYTPRLVEYVTRKSFFKEIRPDDYFSRVKIKFDFPDKIWEEEFSRRHTSIDRIFMFVLYSITDTFVDYSLLKRAFERRLSLLNNLDTSLNHFDQTVKRLNGSFISILDDTGVRMISVLNPSINDYLRKKFYSNPLELEKIQQSVIHLNQIERCYQNPIDQFNSIADKVKSGDILNLSFNSKKEAYSTITLFALELNLKRAEYRKIIHTLLLNCNIDNCEKKYGLSSPFNLVIKNLLENQELFDYYRISNILSDQKKFRTFLLNFDLDRINKVMSCLCPIMIKSKVIDLGNIKDYTHIVQSTIEESVEFWIDEVDLSSIFDSSDLEDIVKDNADDPSGEEAEYDTYSIETEVHNEAKNYLNDKLNSWLGDSKFVDWEVLDQLVDDSKLVDLSGEDIIDLVIDDI